MGRLILVRHGESEANRDRRFTHSDDNPLTELGREQALETARRIANRFGPERVISSTFTRARQTAEIIAGELELPHEVVDDLHERNFGCLKGKPYEAFTELLLGDPSFDPQREWLWKPAGGESHEDVRRRVVAAIGGVRARYSEEDVVVVSHGAVMRCIWAHVKGGWADAYLPPNGGIVVLEHAGERYYPPQIVAD